MLSATTMKGKQTVRVVNLKKRTSSKDGLRVSSDLAPNVSLLDSCSRILDTNNFVAGLSFVKDHSSDFITIRVGAHNLGSLWQGAC